MGMCSGTLAAQQRERPDTTDRRSPAIRWESQGADEVIVVDGERLRQSGARSLGEALAGKVPGLEVFQGSGFASMAQLRLRGSGTLVGADAPLVLVDDVPLRLNASVGSRIAPILFADLPLTAIDRVEIVRGAVAAAQYGPKAYSGVIRIVTRQPPREGLSVSFTQRVGLRAAASLPDVRLVPRDEALTQPLFLVNLTPAQRQAAWDSCKGRCGTLDEIFGGSRPMVETDASARGRAGGTAWSIDLTGRREGGPARRGNENYVGGRAGLDHKWKDRLAIRVNQLVSRTADAQPLSTFDLLTLFARPDWLNLRGVPGAFLATDVPMNPLVAVDSNQSRRALWQYFTTASGTFQLATFGRNTLALQLAGGLHRAVRADTSDAVTGGSNGSDTRVLFAQREASRESFVSARIGLTTVRGSAVGSTHIGAERSGTVVEVGTNETGIRGETTGRAIVADQTWDLGGGRAVLAANVRREQPGGIAFGLDAQWSWRAAGAYRWTVRGGKLRAWGSVGQAQASPLAEPAMVPLSLLLTPPTGVRATDDRASPESRLEFEGGVRFDDAKDRVSVYASGFASTTRDMFVPGGASAGGFSFATLGRGQIRTRGFELALRTTTNVSPSLTWSATTSAWRARSTIVSVDGVFPGGTSLRIGGYHWDPGTSLTRIAQIDPQDSVVTVGDAAPVVSLSTVQELSWHRLHLSAQVDGALGVDVVNETQYGRDTYALSPDQADGGRARSVLGRSGVPVYVQDGGYMRWRELVLGWDLTGHRAAPHAGVGARIEVVARNLATWSPLRLADPAAREWSLPSDIERMTVSPGYPLQRSISVGLVLAR